MHGEETAGGAALAELIKAKVRDVPNPQPGVVFKDITHSSGRRPDAGRGGQRADRGAGAVDKVAGIEARGFILAASVACQLGSGFVPVRKQGRLPGRIYALSYQAGIGTATDQVPARIFAPSRTGADRG